MKQLKLISVLADDPIYGGLKCHGLLNIESKCSITQIRGLYGIIDPKNPNNYYTCHESEKEAVLVAILVSTPHGDWQTSNVVTIRDLLGDKVDYFGSLDEVSNMWWDKQLNINN